MICDHQALASELRSARLNGDLLAPFTETVTGFDLDDAYAVQWEGIQLRLVDGDTIIGAKLGLSSKAKQAEVGLDQPIFSWLTATTQAVDGRIDLTRMNAPRIEPEVALVLGRDIEPAGETVEQLTDAVATVLPALEILDSRYRLAAPSLADVVADGGSGAGFVLGDPVPWSEIRGTVDQLDCQLIVNGATVRHGRSADVLGGPLHALSALSSTVALQGRRLLAGSVILTGGLTRAVPISPGDQIEVVFDGPLGALTVHTDMSTPVSSSNGRNL